MTIPAENDAPQAATPERLFAEVMGLLRHTGTDRLPHDMLFLIPDIDFQEILPRWPELDRLFACAKLAVVRDEFFFRFPAFGGESEEFTFGIKEACAERYQAILRRREPSDITNIVLDILDSLFPARGFFKKRRPLGLTTLGMKLVTLLTAYSQSVETRLYPYAKAFGVQTGE